MKTSYSLISAVMILLFIYSIFQFGIGKRIAPNKIYGAAVIDLTKTPPSVPPVMTTEQMKSPQTIIELFYKTYSNCKTNAQNNADDIRKCLGQNDYASKNLSENIKIAPQPSTDPIVCAENVPQTIYTTNISQPTDSTIKAQVIETFTAGKITINVDLTKENDQWKVDDIDCIKQ